MHVKYTRVSIRLPWSVQKYCMSYVFQICLPLNGTVPQLVQCQLVLWDCLIERKSAQCEWGTVSIQDVRQAISHYLKHTPLTEIEIIYENKYISTAIGCTGTVILNRFLYLNSRYSLKYLLVCYIYTPQVDAFSVFKSSTLSQEHPFLSRKLSCCPRTISFQMLTLLKKYLCRQRQCSRTWDSKCLALIARVVRAFDMNPRVGG